MGVAFLLFLPCKKDTLGCSRNRKGHSMNFGEILLCLAVAVGTLRAQPYQWTTIAGLTHRPGAVDGANSDARFTFPYGVLADRPGIVYVTDSTTIRKLTSLGTDWVVTTIAGRADRFSSPSDLVMDGNGAIYVT